MSHKIERRRRVIINRERQGRDMQQPGPMAWVSMQLGIIIHLSLINLEVFKPCDVTLSF